VCIVHYEQYVSCPKIAAGRPSRRPEGGEVLQRGAQSTPDSIYVFTIYFIFRSVAAYRTVIVAMRCVCHCFNKPLSIYLSIYLSE